MILVAKTIVYSLIGLGGKGKSRASTLRIVLEHEHKLGVKL